MKSRPRASIPVYRAFLCAALLVAGVMTLPATTTFTHSTDSASVTMKVAQGDFDVFILHPIAWSSALAKIATLP